MNEAEARQRLRDFTEKARAHLKEADAYLTAIDDLLQEEHITLPPHMQFRELWNTATKGTPLAACLKLTPARITKVKIALAVASMEEWGQVFARVIASDFCCGKNDRGWVADLDWVIRPETKTKDSTLTKIREGKYDNRQGKPANGRIVGTAAPTAGTFSKLFDDDAGKQ